MGTLKELLDLAEKQIGVSEQPPSSNNVRYNTWYYGREVMGSAYPWCMVFCQWVYNKVNIKLPIRTASCTEMMKAAKANNAWVNNRHMRPGDLVLYNFDNNTANSEHCGIIKSINGIKMEVIEGNTSTSNDANGGKVMLRTRSINTALGAFRPKFEEGGLDMTIDEFITNLSAKQAYTLLEKARSYAASLAEPKWSKDEGYWKAATDKKLVDGKRPEDLIKRDEVIAILGRNGLIK